MSNDCVIQVMVSKDLLNKVQKLADKDDRKISPFVRILLMREVDKTKS